MHVSLRNEKIMEQSATFLHFFSTGIEKLGEELNLFHREEEIWQTTGDISNSAGNLTLHLVGNLNHFLGAQLGKTGYVRDRANEFVAREVHRDVMIRMVQETKVMAEKVLQSLSEEDLAKPFPGNHFGEGKTIGYALIVLLTHLNYHLGQINYLRRIFSPTAL